MMIVGDVHGQRLDVGRSSQQLQVHKGSQAFVQHPSDQLWTARNLYNFMTLHVFWWNIVDLFSWDFSSRDLLYNSVLHPIILYFSTLHCTLIKLWSTATHCFTVLSTFEWTPISQSQNRREQFSKLEISSGASSPPTSSKYSKMR